MIPENYPEPQLMPTRLVQLPDNLTGCRPENGEYDRKKEEDPDKQEFDPAACKTPPPNEEIPGSSAQQEFENLRKARKLVASKSKKYIPPGQSYTALNVRAINRTSENLAQYVNKKEDERLAKKLTSIDREKTVFNNSITRDEKILLQRSKALATVLLARTESYPGTTNTTALTSSSSHKLNQIPTNSRQIKTSTSHTRLHRTRSDNTRHHHVHHQTPPVTVPVTNTHHVPVTNTPPHHVPITGSAPVRRTVSSPDKPCTAKPRTARLSTVKSYSDCKPVLLYGEEVKRVASLKRSKTAKVIRSVSSESTELEEKAHPTQSNTNSSQARLLWANSVNTIMKRDIKAWHKAFLVSRNGNCLRVKPSSISPAEKVLSISPHINLNSTSPGGNHMPSIPDRTPAMPQIVTDKALVSPPVIRERLDRKSLSELFSDRDIDKGAWITNYINTSCAEHFPII